MQVSVERVDDVKRRLTIIVPANKIEEAYVKQINTLVKKANVKGFRPGKMPISYVKQRFGEDARKEAVSEVMQTAFAEAIQQKQLKPITTPQIEFITPKGLISDAPLEFAASFEVLPEIGEIQFSLATLEKPQVQITDDDITKVIALLCKQHTTWKKVERPAQNADRVIIDYDAIFAGEPDAGNKMQDTALELGSGRMLVGFEAGLIGMVRGEEKIMSLQYPNDFTVAERAGKPIEFRVQVKHVYEAEIPEINSDFLHRLGVKSGLESDLREQIKQSLENESARLIKEKIKEQIFKQLLELNPMVVPPSLIAQEAKNIHDEVYAQHPQHDHNHAEHELSIFNDTAKKRVIISLLIAAYANKIGITAERSRVNARIAEIAAAYEDPQQVVNWLAADEQRRGIEMQILEDQVADKLLENIPLIEKNMSYAELKGIHLE